MPLYTYKCSACNASATILKSLSKMERTELCQQCGKPMERVVAPAAAHIHLGTPTFHQRSRK